MTGHRLDRRAVAEEAVCPPGCWTSEEGQPAALPEEDRWLPDQTKFHWHIERRCLVVGGCVPPPVLAAL